MASLLDRLKSTQATNSKIAQQQAAEQKAALVDRHDTIRRAIVDSMAGRERDEKLLEGYYSSLANPVVACSRDQESYLNLCEHMEIVDQMQDNFEKQEKAKAELQELRIAAMERFDFPMKLGPLRLAADRAKKDLDSKIEKNSATEEDFKISREAQHALESARDRIRYLGMVVDRLNKDYSVLFSRQQSLNAQHDVDSNLPMPMNFVLAK